LETKNKTVSEKNKYLRLKFLDDLTEKIKQFAKDKGACLVGMYKNLSC